MADPQLPPATRIRFWAPIVHYGLAAALFAGSIFHYDLHLSGADQTIITLAATILVIAGTGVWVYFHHLSFKTFAIYLKSQVPTLIGDVHALKQIGVISPQVLDQLAKLAKRVDTIEPLVMQLVQGHPGVEKPPAPVRDSPAQPVPVDLASARAEVKAAASDLVTAVEVAEGPKPGQA